MSAGMSEALLQGLKLGNEKENCLPWENLSVLGMLPVAQHEAVINEHLKVLVRGQGI